MEPLSVSLPAEPQCASSARSWVRESCTEVCDAVRCEHVVLAASECSPTPAYTVEGLFNCRSFESQTASYSRSTTGDRPGATAAPSLTTSTAVVSSSSVHSAVPGDDEGV